jgi:hypothetical protein
MESSATSRLATKANHMPLPYQSGGNGNTVGICAASLGGARVCGGLSTLYSSALAFATAAVALGRFKGYDHDFFT